MHITDSVDAPAPVYICSITCDALCGGALPFAHSVYCTYLPPSWYRVVFNSDFYFVTLAN
jgi:hypothetical protein